MAAEHVMSVVAGLELTVELAPWSTIKLPNRLPSELVVPRELTPKDPKILVVRAEFCNEVGEA